MQRLRILTVILVILLLSGCWDRVEIEDIGYVAVIGWDEGGKNQGDFPNNKPPGRHLCKGSGKGARHQYNYSFIRRYYNSPGLASISVARRLTFVHTKAVIASEEFARSDRFYSLIEATQRDRDIRREFSFIICKEKASEFIRHNKPPFDTKIAKYYEFMTSRWRDTGFIPLSTLHLLSQRTIDNLSLFLATYATTEPAEPRKNAQDEGDYLAGQVVKQEDNPIQMMGSAVFKGGKMIGKLTGDETRLSLMLRPRVITNNILISFPDPLKEGERISTELTKKSQN